MNEAAQKLGKLGGQAVKKKYGRKHFVELNKRSAEKKRLLKQVVKDKTSI